MPGAFPHHRFQRKPLVGDPGMHVGSATPRWRGNVPGIPSACTTRDFTYLARGPWDILYMWSHRVVVTVRPVLDVTIFIEFRRINEYHQLWVDIMGHGCHDLYPIFLTCFPALSAPRAGVVIHLFIHVLSRFVGLRVDLRKTTTGCFDRYMYNVDKYHCTYPRAT